MAQVNIPWFTGYHGGQNLYAGKAERAWRQLRGLETGMYDLGYLLRKSRSQGLPEGATDDDLAREEEQLEAELQQSQARARDDTTHGVERATTEGDPAKAQRIKNDPAGYADTGHEERQGFFPKLGNFMVEGVKRLAFGDPRRKERLSHIHEMQGQLQAEKDRENFAKTVGQLCMKSEDPDRCLAEMGGRRFGVTHLPKMTQKPTAAQQAQQPDVEGITPPPKIGGGLENRMDYQHAERIVKERHGGHMPENATDEVYQEYENLQANRRNRVADERQRRSRSDFDYKRAVIVAQQQQRDLANRIAKGGGTLTESWYVYRDLHGREWNLDDNQAESMKRQFPEFGLTKIRKGTRETLPLRDRPAAPAATPPPASTAAPSPAPEDVDEGRRDFGVPFYAPIQ